MVRKARVSRKVQQFTESVIREMTRLAQQYDAVNLAQGFPDFEPPESIKEAACRAIRDGYNQYAVTWGTPRLRRAIADRYRQVYGLDVDPDRQVVVACGSTECMMAAMLAVVDPGDEVIVFEPFYENYGPDGILCGATPRYVPLVEPDWRIDLDALRRAFSPKTKALVLNTPNNPTGRVFRRDELEAIAELCVEWDVLVLTDEIYEYITYDAPHVPMATLPGMADRTVTISGASKTYSVTGWRVGWAVAPPDIADGIKKAHDFLTVGAPHPLQEAIAEALRLPEDYYRDLAAMYRRKRDRMVAGLRALGFRLTAPEGAYYIMSDIRDVTAMDDVAFARWLVQYGGVAVVPGSSFYADPADGRTKVRFNFCKQDATLEEALRRLQASLPSVPY